MDGSLEGFTEHAREVMKLAREEAQGFRHNYIGTEHILLGMVRDTDGIAAKALSNLGVKLTNVRRAVEFIIGRGERQVVGEIGLTPRARRVTELARDEARRLESEQVGTEHLLLGLILEGEGIASGVLESLGVNLERVRREVVRIVTGAEPKKPETQDVWPGGPRWEYLALQTVSRSGSVWVAAVDGVTDPGSLVAGLSAGHAFDVIGAPVHRALVAAGDEGWELVDIDPTTTVEAEPGALYLLKRRSE